jgi:hypothetical protein
MAKQIRRGLFETNSSSVHSMTMCSGDEFNKWKSGEVLFWGEKDRFMTKEEIIEELKKATYYSGKLEYPDVDWDDVNSVNEVFEEESVQTFEEFFEYDDYERFLDSYTTKDGAKVVAFGYYGYDR